MLPHVRSLLNARGCGRGLFCWSAGHAISVVLFAAGLLIAADAMAQATCPAGQVVDSYDFSQGSGPTPEAACAAHSLAEWPQYDQTDWRITGAFECEGYFDAPFNSWFVVDGPYQVTCVDEPDEPEPGEVSTVRLEQLVFVLAIGVMFGIGWFVGKMR